MNALSRWHKRRIVYRIWRVIFALTGSRYGVTAGCFGLDDSIEALATVAVGVVSEVGDALPIRTQRFPLRRVRARAIA
jgi:hypothetical protein